MHNVIKTSEYLFGSFVNASVLIGCTILAFLLIVLVCYRDYKQVVNAIKQSNKMPAIKEHNVSVTISRPIIDLPLDFFANMTKADELVIITAVFNPEANRVFLTLENTNVDGAIQLAKKGIHDVLNFTKNQMVMANGKVV